MKNKIIAFNPPQPIIKQRLQTMAEGVIQSVVNLSLNNLHINLYYSDLELFFLTTKIFFSFKPHVRELVLIDALLRHPISKDPTLFDTLLDRISYRFNNENVYSQEERGHIQQIFEIGRAHV